MDDHTDTPSPDHPPLGISDVEVERLLQQAESLANDIVEEVDTKRAEDVPASTPAGQLGAVEPDPLAAVELVAQDVAQIHDAIEMPDSEVEIKPPPDEPAPTHAQEIAIAGDVAMGANAAAPANTNGTSTPLAAETLIGAPSPTQRAEPNGKEATNESLPPSSAKETTTAPSAGPGRRGGIKAILRDVAVSLPNAFLRCVILVDLPFSRIPASAKMKVGIVGLMTLAMGLAAMTLPRMMQFNPYATMEPLPKAKAETVEHGGQDETKAKQGKESKEAPADHAEQKHEAQPEGGHH